MNMEIKVARAFYQYLFIIKINLIVKQKDFEKLCEKLEFLRKFDFFVYESLRFS